MMYKSRALIVLGAIMLSSAALSEDKVGDIITAGIICTEDSITTIMDAAEISEDAAKTASTLALETKQCVYRPTIGFRVRLVKRVRVLSDYDGDVVAVWNVAPPDSESGELFTWLFISQGKKPAL
jgi:hypothetical protein